MNGIVLKNQNGYFNVLLDNNETASCRSRGKLKKKTDILVGDYDKSQSNVFACSKVTF